MSEPNITINVDGLIPAAAAEKAENVGVAKANMDIVTMFALAVLAGAFIGLGAIFSTLVSTQGTAAGAMVLPFGVGKLLGGLTFCLGLILVVVAGAELFTGNTLLTMAFTSGKITIGKLLRNWGVVYVGNFVGSILTAYVMYLTAQYMIAGGTVGLTALNIADGKCGLDFVPALTRGILCNALVCLAVWLCFTGRTTTDKIIAIVFPITAFVAAGFEHSIANMYFIPVALFIRDFAPQNFWDGLSKTPADFVNLSWGAFFIKNLLPVTIGNIIGGSGFVGAMYWIAFLRNKKKA